MFLLSAVLIGRMDATSGRNRPKNVALPTDPVLQKYRTKKQIEKEKQNESVRVRARARVYVIMLCDVVVGLREPLC